MITLKYMKGNIFQETWYHPQTGKAKQNQIGAFVCNTTKSWVERNPTGASTENKNMISKQLH